MTRSKLFARALALAALLPCVSIVASGDAAAHPYAGGRNPSFHYSGVAVGSRASVTIRRVIIKRFRIR